jgi:hypothetical protein
MHMGRSSHAYPIHIMLADELAVALKFKNFFKTSYRWQNQNLAVKTWF